MALIPRTLLGPYGNGIYGIKTSLEGYDVTVLDDDNDITRRSFNSEWTDVCNIKMIGAAASEWTQYQNQASGQFQPNTPYYYVASYSGWQQVTPVPIPTGLSYIPIWEERVLVNGQYIYDDYIYPSTGIQYQAYSGARSYHSGPNTSPANTLWAIPYNGVPGYSPVQNQNQTVYEIDVGSGNPQAPPYPPYPAYPPKPTNRPVVIYVVYTNKLGDVT